VAGLDHYPALARIGAGDRRLVSGSLGQVKPHPTNLYALSSHQLRGA